jgi:predicted Zn-dependent protease
MKPSKLIAVVSCFAALVCLTGCQDETFHNIYSTEQEQQFGQEESEDIDASEKIDTDAKDNTRVQQVAQAIFAQARKMRPDVVYQIKIIDSPEVNAFSLPGGYEYVYTGLLNKIGDDDDALAAVIGHESAHVVLRHVVKQMSDAGIKGLLVELVGVTTENYNTYNATSAVYELEQLHYSREDEYQADKYGLMFSYNAGYDPQGMIRMFKKLEGGGEGGGDDGDAYAMDHPITRNRILRAEALMKILHANHGTYPSNTDAVTSAAADVPTAAETTPTSTSAPAATGDANDTLPSGPAVISPPSSPTAQPAGSGASPANGSSGKSPLSGAGD